uniref:Uncharacterized protein n=1 Tax=Pseudomonas phage RVTF4 TaxID=3236931 RepID=A0AB39CC96_9VIRU
MKVYIEGPQEAVVSAMDSHKNYWVDLESAMHTVRKTHHCNYVVRMHRYKKFWLFGPSIEVITVKTNNDNDVLYAGKRRTY